MTGARHSAPLGRPAGRRRLRFLLPRGRPRLGGALGELLLQHQNHVGEAAHVNQHVSRDAALVVVGARGVDARP
jgi:hypothetical protein